MRARHISPKASAVATKPTNGTPTTLRVASWTSPHAYIEYAGNANNSGVFGGTLPKYRFYSTLNWTWNDWDVTVGNTWISSVNDTGVNGTSSPIHVSSYTAWDLRVGYDIHTESDKAIKDIKIAVGMNNIGNRMPPPAPRAFTDNNADVATYSPLGRLTYASLEVQF